MRAALMVENDGPLVIEDLVPQGLADHDVEVRIEASGVCRSDLTLLGGLLPPAVLGHELATAPSRTLMTMASINTTG